MSKLRLLRELRKLLARPDTQVLERKQKICGRSTWEYDEKDLSKVWNIRIFLDPRRDGRVRLVIHELIHIYMAAHLNIDRRLVYELEEAATCGWEKLLYDYLHDAKRSAELESWNQAIIRKTV